MPQTEKFDQLIAALDSLSPAEHDTVLRRLRGKTTAVPKAALVVANRGKTEVMVDDGAASPQRLAGGGKLALDIPPLPIVRGGETPTVPDASGMPTAPKSLVSLRASADKGSCDLRVDLTGWLANAARCGWPFAFHRQNEKKAAGRWQFEARPVFDLSLAKSASVDVVVMGLGADLSELAERFALVFETHPAEAKGKARAKADAK